MSLKSKTRIKKKPKKAAEILAKIEKNLEGPSAVRVGLPENSNAYPDGTSVILVGVVHEFGSADGTTPQRSYLRAMLQEQKREFKKLFKKLGARVATGKMEPRQALGLIGVAAQAAAQAKITDIKEPPVEHRGADANPLVDTGHLRQSIIFVVED